MRIVSIHVEGFGVLRGRTLETDSPLTLFYGPNEAGKSTLLGFIRAVLFGFPGRGSRERGERYEPPAGGAHGGALTLLDEQGQRIRVERYDGAAAGRRASQGLVKVTLADGTVGGEELLGTLLGGLSADLYRSLFAFGLTELQELRTLQTDELSGYLYSAGLGVSGAAIMEAERRLTGQAESLYKPRGRNQEINRLLKEVEELEKTLRRSREHTADYDRLQEERSVAEQRIAGLERELRERRGELDKLELAGKARSAWVRLKRLDRELEQLPELARFPDRAAERLDALEQELERLELEDAALARQLEALRGSLAGSAPDSRLLDAQTELNVLLEEAAVYQENRRALAGLEVELEHQRLQAERLLAQIGERWDEEQLSAFPVSIALKEQIAGYRSGFAALHEAVGRKEAELEHLRLQRARLEEALQALERELMPSGGLEDGSDAYRRELDPAAALRRMSKDYGRWQLLDKDLELEREREAEREHRQTEWEEAERQARTGAKRRQQQLFLITAAAALALPAWLLWQGAPGLAAILFAALALLAASIYAGVHAGARGSGRGARSSRTLPAGTGGARAAGAEDMALRRERLERELRALEQSLTEQLEQWQRFVAQRETAAAAAFPGLSAARRSGDRAAVSAALSELEHALDGWLREAEAWKERRGERLRKLDKRKELSDGIAAVRQQERQLAAASGELERERAALRDQWAALLAELRLSGGLSPEAALELLRLVEQGHEALRQKRKQEARQASAQAVVREFERAAGLYLGEAARKEPVLALKRWKEQEQAELERLAERRRGEAQALELEQRQAAARDARQRAEARLRALLGEASAADGGQLRLHQRQQEQRARLLEERAVLEATLESLLGAAELPLIAGLLEAHGEEELARRQAALAQELAELEASGHQLREHAGKLAGAIEKLEQGVEHAELLLQLESRRAAIRQLTGQYAVAAFATQLIKKARDMYERERQPEVLQRASAYFAALTAGRFVQVKAPFGEQRLLAVRAGGELLDTGALSRGTAEQLYLSMRFALAEEYAGKAALPLVLDDILVNFDEVRMEQCLKVLYELSKKHQILLFTCHAHVRDAAQRLIGACKLIELEP